MIAEVAVNGTLIVAAVVVCVIAAFLVIFGRR